MSTADEMSKCAACGNDGDGLKTCTPCKLVKYCNTACQRAHWKIHKKKCKKRAAELHDEAIFKEPPEREECPICMLTLPLENGKISYQACCGKTLCAGCIYAAYRADSRELCPFCRTPEATSDELIIERIKKRAEGDDANAIYSLGCFYSDGDMGLQQDHNKAMELWLRAGELGCAASHHSIANAYANGGGVERDMKKAKYYWELAAMGGQIEARYNLGYIEAQVGNMTRAMKHFMISAGAGDDDSLKKIREGFMNGHATKDDFEKALRAHKDAKDEMKSVQRDAASAAHSTDRGQD